MSLKSVAEALLLPPMSLLLVALVGLLAELRFRRTGRLLLWTGLLFATLRVINPVLDKRIEWRWFFLCQIGFGLYCMFAESRMHKQGAAHA